MEIKGTFHSLSKDYKSNKWLITFEAENLEPELIDEIKEKLLTIIVKVFKKKRSLDSNAYCWVLIDKLAKVMKEKKTDLYKHYVTEIGGVSETVCVPEKSVERLCKGWEHNGLGWQTVVEPSKLKGCKNVILYYGSSTYDTDQMSRLIDMVVEDCKEQGIETATPAEIERMMQLWKA